MSRKTREDVSDILFHIDDDLYIHSQLDALFRANSYNISFILYVEEMKLARMKNAVAKYLAAEQFDPKTLTEKLEDIAKNLAYARKLHYVKLFQVNDCSFSDTQNIKSRSLY